MAAVCAPSNWNVFREEKNVIVSLLVDLPSYLHCQNVVLTVLNATFLVIFCGKAVFLKYLHLKMNGCENFMLGVDFLVDLNVCVVMQYALKSEW